MAEVRMPKMGDGMEEGTINVWLKQEGDQVKEGEPIAEIETDKANVEISAYETGILSKIIVQVGETVAVGEVIARIGDSVAEPVVEAPAEASAEGASAGGERVKASPLARRMAAELGLDIARIPGTGPHGRIIERDVREFSERKPAAEPAPAPRPAAPKPRPKPAPGASPLPPAPHPAPAQGGHIVRPSKMREAIARRTVLSKVTIPHFYATMVIEMDRTLSLLKELNTDVTEGKLTVNDIVLKACAVALAKVPEVNASWTPENTIRQYDEAHIGVAVGIEEGLIIPVVRDCHKKSLRQISADTKALVAKARKHQLVPEEYSGGTFSVSNLGLMGVDEFIAIVNPPEAAILAIGTISRDAVVREGDRIEVASRMKISLSADHRVLDGVTGARFLQEVKKALELPYSLLS